MSNGTTERSSSTAPANRPIRIALAVNRSTSPQSVDTAILTRPEYMPGGSGVQQPSGMHVTWPREPQWQPPAHDGPPHGTSRRTSLSRSVSSSAAAVGVNDETSPSRPVSRMMFGPSSVKKTRSHCTRSSSVSPVLPVEDDGLALGRGDEHGVEHRLELVDLLRRRREQPADLHEIRAEEAVPGAEGEVQPPGVPRPLQVGDELDQRPEARPLLLLVDGVDVVVVQSEAVAQGAQLAGHAVRVDLGDGRRHGAHVCRRTSRTTTSVRRSRRARGAPGTAPGVNPGGVVAVGGGVATEGW